MPEVAVTPLSYDQIRPIVWDNDRLKLIDQRLLPSELTWLSFTDVADVSRAITDMVVRGAPAIGITAAYAVVLAAKSRYQQAGEDWKQHIQPDLELLINARSTAVNLKWAVDRMRGLFASIDGDPFSSLLAEARRIHASDIAANRCMGELGAALIEPGSAVLTHCNAGSLATGGYGTALGVIRSAYGHKKIRSIYANETRPWLQGARLTAWELIFEAMPVILIADGAGAHLMKTGAVQWVIVGSDRIAANGDVANKIGTYAAAVAARYHGVKFMVVAPTSTIDMSAGDGDQIPIENRSPDEVLTYHGQPLAPPGADAWNPAFDVTPAALVDVIVTEKGVIESPDAAKIVQLMDC